MISYNTILRISRALTEEMILNEAHKKKSFHVSFIVSNKSIIAIGTNGDDTKTHPLLAERYGDHCIIHSELAAYMKINAYLRKNDSLTLINVRLNRQLVPKMAKPCMYCLPWCRQVFDEMWYTTDKGLLEKL